jgi:SAM-dependent MidA family methyltransferase
LNRLQRLIAEVIDDTGPLDFAAYMDLALYHPEFGYYAAGKARSDWSGDFVTSPQMDPAFGGLCARAFERVWEACGAPDSFAVVEIGPGEGGFARSVVDAAARSAFGEALQVVLVERIPALEERQRALLDGAPVTWVSSIEAVMPVAAGCLFANEVLDNTPVHLLRKTNGVITELYVIHENGDLRLESGSPSPAIAHEAQALITEVPDGTTFELGVDADRLLETAAGKIDRGVALLFDYGDTSEALRDRQEGTVVCYSARGVDDRPLEDPGTKDITAHVDWTRVSRVFSGIGWQVSEPTPQHSMLRSLGAAGVIDALREAHDRAVERGDGAAALQALSRRGAVSALLDPGGLGGLTVLVATRGVGALSF